MPTNITFLCYTTIKQPGYKPLSCHLQFLLQHNRNGKWPVTWKVENGKNKKQNEEFIFRKKKSKTQPQYCNFLKQVYLLYIETGRRHNKRILATFLTLKNLRTSSVFVNEDREGERVKKSTKENSVCGKHKHLSPYHHVKRRWSRDQATSASNS